MSIWKHSAFSPSRRLAAFVDWSMQLERPNLERKADLGVAQHLK